MPMNALKPEHEGRAVVVGGAINDVREIMTKNGSKMAFVKLEDKHAELELILFPSVYQQTTGLWERDKVILARGKISAKDREGNIGEEIKIMVDDAREITGEQALNYQPTGKKMRPPGSKKSAAAAVTATKARTADDQGKAKSWAKTNASSGAKGSAARAPVPTPAPERVYIRLHDSENHELLHSIKQSLDEAKGSTEVVLVLGPTESKQIIKLPTGIDRTDGSLKKLRDLVGADNIKIR